MFFNGFTLLLCILSALLGATVSNYLRKGFEDYDLEHGSDTPIYDKLEREWGYIK